MNNRTVGEKLGVSRRDFLRISATTAAATGVLVACTPAAASVVAENPTKVPKPAGSKIKIAWTSFGLGEPFNMALASAATAEAAKHRDVEFILQDSQADSKLQLQQLEAFIAQKVDAVILHPANPEEIAAGADEVIGAGIPLITIPQKVPTEYCGYIGFDDILNAQNEMTWVAEQLNGKGNILILMGATGHPIVNDRNTGIENALKNFPDIKVLDRQDGEWAKEKSMQITENWLQAHGDQIDAVVSHTDVMAMGAVDVLQSAGKTKVIIAGIDGYEAALQYIREGKMHYTSALDMPSLGGTAVRLSIYLATSANPNLKAMGRILVPNVEIKGAADANNFKGW